MVNVMELMPNLRGPVMLEGGGGGRVGPREKTFDIFVRAQKTFRTMVAGGEDQLMQRSVNVSYPLPACPSDRRQFGSMAPLLTPRICIFRCSLSSPNREPPISPSNCESGKQETESPL